MFKHEDLKTVLPAMGWVIPFVEEFSRRAVTKVSFSETIQIDGTSTTNIVAVEMDAIQPGFDEGPKFTPTSEPVAEEYWIWDTSTKRLERHTKASYETMDMENKIVVMRPHVPGEPLGPGEWVWEMTKGTFAIHQTPAEDGQDTAFPEESDSPVRSEEQ